LISGLQPARINKGFTWAQNFLDLKRKELLHNVIGNFENERYVAAITDSRSVFVEVANYTFDNSE